MQAKLSMPYIGRALSVNYYKDVGPNGNPTKHTRLEVQKWMQQLAEKVKYLDVEGQVTVELYGRFRDKRVPDLNNLHKVVADALRDGLGVDDRYFNFVDHGYSTGWVRPRLEITISDERG